MAIPTLQGLNIQLSQIRETALQTGTRQETGIEQGLRLRVTASGKATFAYRYRAPGTNALRTITLASIGKRIASADLEAALELHRSAKRDRDAAIDPLAKRDGQRLEAAKQAEQLKADKARRQLTVQALVTEYLDEISRRKRSWKEDERILHRNVVPLIGAMPFADVDLKAVRLVLGALDDRPAMKKNVQAAARACWSWRNPSAPNPWKAEKVPVPKPRERVLTVGELRDLLMRFDAETDLGRDAVELLLLTGTRRLEVMEARRDEFNGNEWRIPASRMKANRDHVVLLSNPVQALVGRILGGHGSRWLLPSPSREDRPVSRERAYKWLRESDVVTYSLHDMRRTMASHLGEQLIHDAVIDRVLAHRKQGVIKHYNHAKLTEPARQAWQSWADYLDSIRSRTVSIE